MKDETELESLPTFLPIRSENLHERKSKCVICKKQEIDPAVKFRRYGYFKGLKMRIGRILPKQVVRWYRYENKKITRQQREPIFKK